MRHRSNTIKVSTLYTPYDPCMVYLPTFGSFLWWMQVSIPYMDPAGLYTTQSLALTSCVSLRAYLFVCMCVWGKNYFNKNRIMELNHPKQRNDLNIESWKYIPRIAKDAKVWVFMYLIRLMFCLWPLQDISKHLPVWVVRWFNPFL